MFLTESDADELRNWIIKRLEALEAIADADVLADFVIALLRTDTEESQLRIDAEGELIDFLKDHTAAFVAEVFKVVKSRSYTRGYIPPPLPKPTRSGIINEATENGKSGKKRTYNDQGDRGPDRKRQGRQKYKAPDMPFPFPLEQPDPFAAMAAMQALGFPMPMPMMQSPKKCRDYETKGFCARGNACRFLHGDDMFVVPGENDYDPRNPGVTMPRGRANISQTGPMHDRAATTIVVEQIPEENHNEKDVRAFFEQFGAIAQVRLQPYRRLAILKFETYDSASAAYNSPKAIFDNRFVKCYWHKSEKKEETFDAEGFAKRSEEAQQRLEEKKVAMEALAAEKKALNEQKAELAVKQAEEKRKLQDRLERRNGEEVVSDNTKALRAKLAVLEAEAAILGIDPVSPRGRGRGRGRGYRGFERHRWNGGGRYNLDLRTKSVSVTAEGDWDDRKDEALRQYLLSVGEYEAITNHSSNTVIVTLKDRITAESFFYGSRTISEIGMVKLDWFKAETTQAQTNGSANGDRDGDVGMEDVGETQNGRSVGMDDVGEAEIGKPTQEKADVDYDVAEEDERWG